MSLKTLQQELKELSNPKRAAISQSFFKTGKGEYGEGDVFIGITMPELRTLAKKFESVSLSDVHALLHSNIHEYRMIALLIMCNQYKKGSEKQKTAIYQLYLDSIAQCINNWDLVDVSAHHIVGAYLQDKDRKSLYKLAASNNLWERRVSIIATMQYIRAHDLDDTFAIAEILLHDTHDLIHKSVGWMLREAGKKDVKQLKAFLDTHVSNMPRTMLRYAIERLPERERKEYLKK